MQQISKRDASLPCRYEITVTEAQKNRPRTSSAKKDVRASTAKRIPAVPTKLALGVTYAKECLLRKASKIVFSNFLKKGYNGDEIDDKMQQSILIYRFGAPIIPPSSLSSAPVHSTPFPFPSPFASITSAFGMTASLPTPTSFLLGAMIMVIGIIVPLTFLVSSKRSATQGENKIL